eukprot:1161410-Pelagomonas_calceolata.AAC.9
MHEDFRWLTEAALRLKALIYGTCGDAAYTSRMTSNDACEDSGILSIQTFQHLCIVCKCACRERVKSASQVEHAHQTTAQCPRPGRQPGRKREKERERERECVCVRTCNLPPCRQSPRTGRKTLRT